VRLLLDTHTVLWWLLHDPALSERARDYISEPENTAFVSAASAWEIATKVRIGKLHAAANLAFDLSTYLERERFGLLAISVEHAIRAGLLGGPHRDPFDRMLVAQSQAESMPVVSNDRVFDAYGVHRIW
jgi:PIN domain nuclease of toxin-antitoxin system